MKVLVEASDGGSAQTSSGLGLQTSPAHEHELDFTKGTSDGMEGN